MEKYRVTENQIAAENDNKTIILQFEAGEYFGLDNVGSLVWNIIEKAPATLAELKAGVMEQFDVDEATCEKDIAILLEQLIAEKLIEKTA